MPENVDVHAPTAVQALAQWDAATSGITRALKEGQARIQRLVAAAPWGDDSAGASFHTAYIKDASPEMLARIGEMVMQDVEEVGGKVRTAVGNTRRTDKAQAGTTLSI
ncbi:hypothetical protein ABZU32_00790 [Sphaerisporangium sp. NPDC005288]|uniref:WXG100 family type VII secretion target n=1 Tax=Sphaerisporangium rhizosphaerae TaxID=2269375 RepID=A0ABW2NY69_9ACTN